METFARIMDTYLVPPLTKLGDIKQLRAIRNGMIATVPFTIVGSIFLIICFLPIGGWSKIIAPYQSLLMVPVNATFGMLAVITSIAVAYNMAREYKQDAIIGALLSVVTFLMINLDMKTGAINMDGLNSNGLFTAIIVAFIAVEIQNFFVSRNLVIKLPENVPPAVARSFISISPLACLLVLMWVVRFVLHIDINAIVTLVFSPFVFALNTLPGCLVLTLVITLLWCVGLHGDNITAAVSQPITMAFLAANATAMAAGKPMSYIAAYGFQSIFINVGGTGATIAILMLLLRSKEVGLRQLARMAFPSGCFNINEPVTFGLPIVLNPIMMLPYIVVPMVLTASTYLLMAYDIIGKPFVSIPWTTPPIIAHYLLTGGDWRAAVWGVVEIVIMLIIYYPFVKAFEKKRLAEEAAIAEQA